MTDEEWKAWKIGRAGAMMNAAPKHSLEDRVRWLEADSAAQRTAILKLKREVKRLINGGTILAGLVGLLLGRVFL
jgi:hypothetical protein